MLQSRRDAERNLQRSTGVIRMESRRRERQVVQTERGSFRKNVQNIFLRCFQVSFGAYYQLEYYDGAVECRDKKR